MKGHVRERSPGKWAIVIDIYDEDGKRKRKWHTFHTTSKRKGRRVALSASVADELRSHMIRQAEELLRLSIRQDECAFVYAQEDGAPIQPRSLTQGWMKAISATELPRIRFHDLRHAHAMHLLASGVHPKVASERLGHSRVGVTLDLYSHVLPGMQEDAASRVDEALRLAIEKRAAKDVR